MYDLYSIALIFVAFFLGGIVKGIAGMGLPLIAIPILSTSIGLQEAVVLLVAPAIAANVFQVISIKGIGKTTKRIAPYLLPSLVTIWLGTALLTSTNKALLTVFLGGLLFVYAVTNMFGFSVKIPARHEWWIGPVFGAVNGVITGLSGIVSTPSVIYINGLDLDREEFIQALGILFLLAYCVLSVALWSQNLLTVSLGIASLLSIIPTAIALKIGYMIRRNISEQVFKRFLFQLLALIGISMIAKVYFAG
ncbi:MAG: hypothetical protein COC23_05815 [Hyphomicrobiales bacterium]|nr:MAG: hypothetical protein COC23_05815 [Hyphomicrobiales bacterium]